MDALRRGQNLFSERDLCTGPALFLWSVHGQFHGQQLCQVRNICCICGTNVIIYGTPSGPHKLYKNREAR